MMKNILISFFIFMVSFQIQAKQVITFATEATYPPIVSMDKNGKIIGFEAELIQVICQKLEDATCLFSHQPWDSIIPGLKFDKFDAAFGGLGSTVERAKQVSFTHILYENPGSFLFLKNKKFSFTDMNLSGKTIGAQSGTTFLTYLRRTYQNKITIKSYASIQEAIMDLNSGRIDAIFGDGPVLKYSIKNKQNQYEETEVAKEAFYTPGNAVAVKKENTKLLNQLNRAISDIKSDGTFDLIYKKYF